jgi:hypothetical protein
VSNHNKAVPAKFKDECADKVAKSFIGLKAKQYSILLSDQSIKRACKGVPRRVAATYTHDLYREVLYENKQVMCESTRIECMRHQLYVVRRQKAAMNGFDDKRYSLDPIHSLAYGHKEAVRLHRRQQLRCDQHQYGVIDEVALTTEEEEEPMDVTDPERELDEDDLIFCQEMADWVIEQEDICDAGSVPPPPSS